jgi:hypothetical protein
MKRRGVTWRSWGPTLLLACAGACGGDGDAPISYTPVSATSDGDLHTLKLGDLKMVVDASTGARITEFSLRGTNALVTQDESLYYYGATYWPSPQSSWCAPGGVGDCWPPLEAIDNKPYTGSTDAANLLHLTSAATSIPTVADSAIVVGKHFRPVPESGAIEISYTLTNTSPTASLSLAPWQVSRVAAGGITFFGPGSGPVTYAANSDPAFMVTEGAGALWYESAPVHHDSKLFADGTGWLAQATPQRLLLLQSFPDIQPADAAPGEAEIEVFTNTSYVEIEAQGALTTLAPGDTLAWTVRWKLRRLPGGTTVAAGNAELAAFASAALAE